MECMIPARSLRSFSKVIGCMAKIGEEITFEASKSKLTLSAVDSARTAFVKCTLLPGFYENYQVTSSLVTNGDDRNSLKCRVLLKSLAHIFKGKQLEKTVEKTLLSIGELECRVVCQHMCKHGITKTHKVIYEDCERLMNANYSKETAANRISLPHKFLTEWLGGFSQGLEEITWIVDHKGLKIQSFSENAVSNTLQRLETKFIFGAEEFGHFQVTEKAQMTFSFKEFKAILALADAFGQSVEVYFSGERGNPILFFLFLPDMVEMDFVLATFNPKIQDNDTASEASHSQDSRKSAISSQQKSSGGPGHKGCSDGVFPSPLIPQNQPHHQKAPQPQISAKAAQATRPKAPASDNMDVDNHQYHYDSRGEMDVDDSLRNPRRDNGVADKERRQQEAHQNNNQHRQRQEKPFAPLPAATASHDDYGGGDDHDHDPHFVYQRGHQRESGERESGSHDDARLSRSQQHSRQNPAQGKRLLENGVASPRSSLPHVAGIVPRQPAEVAQKTSAADIANVRQSLSDPSRRDPRQVHYHHYQQHQHQQQAAPTPGSSLKNVRRSGDSPSHFQFPFHSPDNRDDNRGDSYQAPHAVGRIPLVGTPSVSAPQRRSSPAGHFGGAPAAFSSRSSGDRYEREERSFSDRAIPTRETDPNAEDGEDPDDFVEGTPPPFKAKFKSLF